MDIINRSRLGKMNVLIYYSIYIYDIIIIQGIGQGSSYVWYQATDKGAINWYELQEQVQQDEGMINYNLCIIISMI